MALRHPRWFRDANSRRIELIGKRGLSADEQSELKRLNRVVAEYVDGVHPLPPIPMEGE